MSPAWRVLPQLLSPSVRAELQALARAAPAARWRPGRQGTGYDKLLLEDPAPPWLASLTTMALALLEPTPPDRLLGWDRWLLRYGVGDGVPRHVDPPLSEGWRHLRLNALVLAGDGHGGRLLLDDRPIDLAPGDAILFRPDETPHEVTPVTGGERLVFSIGCNIEPAAG